MNLSRRSHEDERADRLSQWKEVFTELESLSADERSAVQTFFAGTTETRTAIQEKLEAETDLDMDGIELALERVTSVIDDISALKTAYETKSQSTAPVVSTSPPSTSGQKSIPMDSVAEALKHVSELEQLYETVDAPTRPRDMYQAPEEEETSVLDEKLEEVIPGDAFKESKRQKILTEEEGYIISAYLPGPSTSAVTSSAIGADAPAPVAPTISSVPDPARVIALEMEEEVQEEDTREPMTRLDDLIEAVPPLRDVYERRLAMPTPADHDACMELVTRMGVPVIKAAIPYEAEGLAASLARAGLVDYVGTEDSDVIAYEAPLLRNMSSSLAPLTLVSGRELREVTNLPTSAAFVDFCILLGTDASPRIPTIGPRRAFALIHKYHSIERILEAEPKVRAKLADVDVFMALVANARAVFGTLPPIPEGLTLEQGEYDQAKVERWLAEEHGVEFVSPEEVDSWNGFAGQQATTDNVSEDESAPTMSWDESWGEPEPENGAGQFDIFDDMDSASSLQQQR